VPPPATALLLQCVRGGTCQGQQPRADPRRYPAVESHPLLASRVPRELADGLDINHPDFIRGGLPIFTDYADFTAEGPDAPTDGREAFGDASSIAAQGNVVYDLSQVVNPAHPLPPGCTVRVRGVAPGASLVALKIFGQSTQPLTS
jgi:hypothetical protein